MKDSIPTVKHGGGNMLRDAGQLHHTEWPMKGAMSNTGCKSPFLSQKMCHGWVFQHDDEPSDGQGNKRMAQEEA